MECVRRIGETRGHVTAGLGDVEVRVEHDLRATSGCPAHRLRIPPTLMADHDPKRERADLEYLSARAGRVGCLLRGIELNLVLDPGDSPVRVDHQCGDYQRTAD